MGHFFQVSLHFYKQMPHVSKTIFFPKKGIENARSATLRNTDRNFENLFCVRITMLASAWWPTRHVQVASSPPVPWLVGWRLRIALFRQPLFFRLPTASDSNAMMISQKNKISSQDTKGKGARGEMVQKRKRRKEEGGNPPSRFKAWCQQTQPDSFLPRPNQKVSYQDPTR